MPDENQEVVAREVRTLTTMLEKHDNNAIKLAESLLADNAEWRKKNRELKEQLPKDGTVVLSADDAKEYNKFKQLLTDSKADLKTIKEIVEKYPALETENKTLAKRDKLRDVQVLGYDLDILEERMQAYPEAVISVKKIKDEKDATKEVSVPFVSHDDKELSLDDFAKANFPKYLPVLKVNTENQTPISAHTFDPPPSAAAFNDEEDKTAKNSQAQAAHSYF